MRTSKFLLVTLRETPHDADTISQQLMLRAGLIRKLASGLYTWLPLGLRVLKKVEAIVRTEMNAIDAQEILMPTIQPAELWQETHRWEKYGRELLTFTDRHERPFCYGPTHEEVVTDLMRGELSSYKQLPITLYQIQVKFRDEIRPRFGVMRAREFIMKDAYSFHLNQESLDDTYQNMYRAYCNIFTRLGLSFRAVEADTGSIGGRASHEFQVLANAGEDLIFYSNQSSYAANVEQATAAIPEKQHASGDSLKKIATPNQRSIAEVSGFLNISPEKMVKCVLVKGSTSPVVALILRGNDELNEIKAAKIPELVEPLTMASAEEIIQAIGAEPGSIGPINLNIPFYVDHAAAALADFTCGANETGFHYLNANWEDITAISADLRKVTSGDQSPDGLGTLEAARGIEVGHIFDLGKNYSAVMNLTVLNEQGKAVHPVMGCYGIGVSRIVAAAIEQNHDDKGIIWPDAMTPFQIALIGINAHRCEAVREKTEQLYQELQQAGFDILYDDRNERPGVMFSDIELIGIPHRIVISEKLLAENQVEYKNRNNGKTTLMPISELTTYFAKLFSK